MAEEHSEAEAEIFSRVKGYLKRLDLLYFTSEEDRSFSVPYRYPPDAGKIHAIVIAPIGEWLYMICNIVRSQEIPLFGDKMKVLEALLRNSLYTAGASYALNKSGDIVVYTEIHKDNLSYEQFKMHLAAVVHGIKKFFDKIAPSAAEQSEKSENLMYL
ncbi:MAG: hypothetical protein DRN99_06525 [Thermoproteota archaeon]|nr:MAG: hypothetical protein DRN99_06525 [Candidatus Korarchaeota archaeon]